MSRWPRPEAGANLELPVLGRVLTLRVPVPSERPEVCLSIPVISTVAHSVCLSVCFSASLILCLSVCLCISLSVSLSLCLSLYLPVFVSLCLSLCRVSLCLSVCLSLHRVSLCLSLYRSVYLPVLPACPMLICPSCLFPCLCCVASSRWRSSTAQHLRPYLTASFPRHWLTCKYTSLFAASYLTYTISGN
jgi:hypothetical protein